MLKKILHGIDKLNDFIGKIDSYLLIIIIVATFYEVVVRYFMKNPTSWSNELCSIIFGIYMMLGGGYVHMKKAHVSMDIFSSRFSARTKAVVGIVTSVFTFTFLIVLIWKGGQRAIQTIQMNEHSTTVWAPSMIPTRLALPVGCIFFLLQVIAEFIRNIIILVKGEAGLEY
jgi:TRAP-type mannitol/chloroaromatic compound transport system permease small subunit